jgi:hypothetical protein
MLVFSVAFAQRETQGCFFSGPVFALDRSSRVCQHKTHEGFSQRKTSLAVADRSSFFLGKLDHH